MQLQQIEKIENGEVFAKFIKSGNTFSLVAYHMGKDFTREEALKIKNQYGMKPFSRNYVYGYEGVIPKSVFVGGKKMVLT